MPIKGIKGGVGTKALGYGLGGADGEETDSNFNQTVLLLHGDGSEGAGNTSALGDPNYKAFKDNSTSAHAIAVGGDVYGNDFSPYYYANGYWSNFFDGSNDSLELATSADWAFGTGDFTIEMWVYAVKTTEQSLYDGRSSNGAYPFLLIQGSTGKFMYYVNTAVKITANDVVPLNQWVHLALVRYSSTTKMYVNGVAQTETFSDSTNYLEADVVIGENNPNGGDNFEGYLSNYHVIKGTAKYTSNFTPSTSPVTTVANTKLLTCQSNRFIDNSTSSHALTLADAPKVSTNTPFTQSKTANVGSGFFTGSNYNGLTTATSSDFAFGTNNFTFECWVYPFSVAGTQVILDLRDTNDGDQDHMSALVWTGTKLDCYSGGNYSSGTDLGNHFSANSWNHIAVQRSGNNLYHSVNGIVSSSNPSFTRNLNANGLATIGGNVGLSTSMFTGYIADMRVVNGTAVYGTSNFSVPTTSLTAVTNTKLLTCQYSGAVRNVGFVDDSKYNHQVIRSGDTTLGTFSPFSLEDTYWSEFYNNSSDSGGNCNHKILPASFLNDLTVANKASSTKTIEAWVYPAHIRTNANQYYAMAWFCKGNIYFDCGLWSTSSTTEGKFVAYHNDVGVQRNLASSNTFTINQWYHVAVVIASETLKIYVDGVLEASGTWYGIGSTGIAEVSVIGGTASNNDWNGYISNLRVSSTARYTSAFTPSTSPFTSDSDTLLLTNQSNRFVDNSSSANTFTFQKTPKVLPFSPFTPSRSYSKDAVGGSMFLDGNGDYIYAEGNSFKPFKVLSNSEFSIELWYYRLTAGSTDVIISSDVGDQFQLVVDSSDKLDVYMSGSRLVSSPTFPLASNPQYTNAWNHFVMTREDHDTKIRTFINGELVSITAANTGVADFDDLIIGYQGKGSNHPTHGYMAGVKFSNSGVPSAYQTTETSTGTQVFTPPTAPVTADTNTQLLLNFNNAGIIDHTMKNNLETEGNVRISGQQTKFGTGSIYFDGTDDRIVLPYQEYQQLGTDEFTVELFVYFTSTNQRQGFFGNDQGWYFQIYDGELEFALSVSAVIERSFSHSINQWYHLAATRDSSNDIRLFIDGTQQGAVVNSTADLRHASNNFHIGNIGPATGRPFAGGYMDEIRIIKGTARYTSNFTVPTKAFANR